LFPVGPLKCIETLRRLSGNQMLLIAGDKGIHQLDQLEGARPPWIAQHGSVSIDVNFHAIAEYGRIHRGLALDAPAPHASINVMGLAFGSKRDELPNTRASFHHAIETRGPDDVYQLKKGMERSASQLSLSEMLSFLRLTCWDARILSDFYPRL